MVKEGCVSPVMRLTPQLVAIGLSIISLFSSCDVVSSQSEREFKSDIQRLKQMFQEYYQVPVKQMSYGNDIVAWKDPAQLKLFYDRNRQDISAIDQRLLELSNKKENNVWRDDAVFCRAILHVLWTVADPEIQTMERSLVVLTGFGQSSLATHFQDFTKEIMQAAFLGKQQGFLSPNYSYEQNAQLAVRVHVAQLLVKLKNYDEAIHQIESIAKTYPTSGYSQHYAAGQIQAIKDLTEGTSTLPDTLPEGR